MMAKAAVNTLSILMHKGCVCKRRHC